MNKQEAIKRAKNAARRNDESYVVFYDDGQWDFCSYAWWTGSNLPQYDLFISADGSVSTDREE